MTDGKIVRNWQYPQPITIELGLILMSLSIFVITPDTLSERKKQTFLEVRAKVLNMFLQLDPLPGISLKVSLLKVIFDL